MNIVVQGSLAFDRIMDFPDQFAKHILPDHIHQLSVSFFIEELTEKRGGTAGNIAYNLMLLGEARQVELFGAVGKDFEEYMQHLNTHHLSTQYISVDHSQPTASAYAITDEKNNQIWAFHLGAEKNSSKPFDWSTLNGDDAIVISAPRNNKIDVMTAAAECKARGIRFLFDPGQTIPIFTGEELKKIITGSYMFISNDYELQLIVDKTGWSKKELQKKVDVHISTLGENGSTIVTNDDTIDVPSCVVSVVKDPTGAGDAYRAGLIKGLIQGVSLEQAGKMGSLCATYAIEQYGTQEHTFTIKEFAQRYFDNFTEECPIG